MFQAYLAELGRFHVEDVVERDLGRPVSKQRDPALGDLLAVLVLVDGHRPEHRARIADTTGSEGFGELRVPLPGFELDQGSEIEGVHQAEFGEVESRGHWVSLVGRSRER
jgi:hypothetical protein